MSGEYFETFDDNGYPIGIAPRSQVHREGLWHRAANVFLFRSDGRLILQQRSWCKDVCPGMWDLSVAEHLRLGETYEEGALRGLREELGVEGVALQRIGDVTQTRLDLPAEGIKDYELQQSFRGVFDGELRPDRREVCGVDSVAVTALAVALTARPSDFTPWFRDTAARLDICGEEAERVPIA